MAQLVVNCVVVNVVSRNMCWMVSMWKFMVSMWKFMVVYMNIFRVVNSMVAVMNRMVRSSMAGVWWMGNVVKLVVLGDCARMSMVIMEVVDLRLHLLLASCQIHGLTLKKLLDHLFQAFRIPGTSWKASSIPSCPLQLIEPVDEVCERGGGGVQGHRGGGRVVRICWLRSRLALHRGGEGGLEGRLL